MSKTLKFLCALSVFSCVAGAFLALVRSGALFSAAPFSVFYICLGVCAALTLLFCLLPAITAKDEGFASASPEACAFFNASFSKLYRAFAAVSCVLVGFSGVLYLFRISSSKVAVVNALFLILCAVTMFLRTAEREKGEKSAVFSLFPVYFLCFFLLLFYRANAKTAALDVFGPEALSIALLIFAVYINAAVKFSRIPPFIRYFSALFSLELAIFELVCFFIDSSLLSSVAALPFILMSCGFSLFSAASVFLPPLRLFNPKSK